MFDTTPSPTFDAPTGTDPRSMNGVLVLLLVLVLLMLELNPRSDTEHFALSLPLSLLFSAALFSVLSSTAAVFC